MSWEKLFLAAQFKEKNKDRDKGIGWKWAFGVTWRSGATVINEYKIQPRFFPEGLLNEAIRDSSGSLQMQRFCPAIKK